MWVEEQKLHASDGAVDDLFGSSVSISGAAGSEVAIVGVWSGDDNGTNSGSAYIYRKSGAIWVEEQKLLASDAAVGDLFGHSVSINSTPGNEVVIVGAMFDDDNGSSSGSSYVYRYNGLVWVEESKLLASDGALNDNFGNSVSISGTPGNEVAIIGARRNSDFGSFTGSAYIYRKVGAIWIEEIKLLASDAAGGDFYGVSVSISGTPGNEVAIVGSSFDDDNGPASGSAYIYRFNGVAWVEEQKIIASDGATNDFFGYSVSIISALGNEVAIVGAYQDDDYGAESGSAYIFRFNGTTWIEEGKLLASDGASSDNFGQSVSISGDSGNEVAIAGAHLHDDNGLDSGSAYIYRRSGSIWVEEQKLIASDGAEDDLFGFSVSISGAPGNELAIIGAYQDDDNCTDSGSAYIYRRSGAIWDEEVKLLASDGALDDLFGWAVSINDEIAFVGMPGDDDNGSAYIYRFISATWEEEAKILATDGALGDEFGKSISINGASGNEVVIVAATRDDDNGSNAGSTYVLELPCGLGMCPADMNCSGEVNVTDLLGLLGAWGPCPVLSKADTNSDGNVNITDLLALLAAWGPCP